MHHLSHPPFVSEHGFLFSFDAAHKFGSNAYKVSTVVIVCKYSLGTLELRVTVFFYCND